MLRTLRTKLILLTLVVITSVLLVSTLLSLYLSQKVLESRAQEEARRLSRMVALHAPAVLRTAGEEVLTQNLRSLKEEHRRAAAIEVFLFDGADTEVVSSHSEIPVAPLTPEEEQALRAGRPLSVFTMRGSGRFVNLITPVHEDGAVVGAARVRIFLPGVQRLRTEGAYATAFLALVSGLSLFFLLSVFLDGQVTRPLGQLVTAMNAAEAGNLQARAHIEREDEIGQLTAHFNRMLARIEQADTDNHELVARLSRFNEELEKRVAQATRVLGKRNEELLRLQREMGRVEPLAALGRITATIAHELGTPLNSVLGYTQLLARENLPESTRPHLQTIESQVRRMADTIRYYLAHTRGSPRAFHTVNVNTLVRETLALLEPIFQQHKVQVATVLEDSLPSLSADGHSLQRVLINLLNNAVDAMAAGGTVTVTTREAAPPEISRLSIVVEVKDTGAGIPPQLVAKMFSLFTTTKEPGKGSGLGLAISQEIVRAHGGTINIASRVGEGTCVEVFLPITNERVHHSSSAEGKV